jgi:hypothetical protein
VFGISGTGGGMPGWRVWFGEGLRLTRDWRGALGGSRIA